MKWINSAKIKSGLMVVATLAVALFLIGFAERNIATTTYEEVKVSIDHQNNNYFLHEKDVMAILSSQSLPVMGSNYSEVELKNVENAIRKNKFVDDVQVHKDLKGGMSIVISQKNPLARIIQERGPSAYISESGDLLPMSSRYTARVMLISGKGAVAFINDDAVPQEQRDALLSLLKFIHADKFWKAQIAQIEIDSRGEVTFYTQISKQYVQFGKIEDVANKFEKLRIFYKQILPQKGWNKYERVDLRFKDQIVCE